ncbi:DUF4350 domain-containing protein [Coleofasciculus chthonoplastes]|uniref:DUF4350 domain-containing protein n=1 Tax=Coleofasciculus chthonoplastes TaxID=64178 RepID=UPI0032F946C0
MNISKRRLGVLSAIAIAVMILITLVAAPANNKLNSGSTYSRAPDGYGAWYTFMAERGTPIQRWQKPLSEFEDRQDVTLLRVHSRLVPNQLDTLERDWVKKGNTLIIVGVHQPVTEAEFSTLQDSPVGNVKIDTRRRHKSSNDAILSDDFGAIIWQQQRGKGQVIFVTTPYLAANAYQDFPANYELLAKLVTHKKLADPIKNPTINSSANPNQLWVDEYIHGYKDKEEIEREVGENAISYLIKTPLFPLLIQGIIILLVAIWAANRRLGQPVTLSAPVVNNSEAYIRALAAVLLKAGSHDFVVDRVGKAEQQQLQKDLGLGETPLNHQSLVAAWARQTGRPAKDLEQLLQVSNKRRLSESDLLNWLRKWSEL